MHSVVIEFLDTTGSQGVKRNEQRETQSDDSSFNNPALRAVIGIRSRIPLSPESPRVSTCGLTLLGLVQGLLRSDLHELEMGAPAIKSEIVLRDELADSES